MSRFTNTALAACAALFLSLASLGAIIAVPPAKATVPATIATAELA